MTEQKKLKRLVRTRIASTSESYTTARRHVLARAARPAPLPSGIVDGYRTFGPAQHHESGLLAHVLEAGGIVAPHTGRPYSEAMLNGMGGGIGFMYAVFEYTNLPPLMTIVAQHHPDPWVPTALGHLGIAYREEHSAKPAPALGTLRASLDDGRPVLCLVDRSRLPWHGMEPGYGMDPYLVVVAGTDGEALYVDDEGPVPRPLDAEVFVSVWSAYRKGRHGRVDRYRQRRRRRPSARGPRCDWQDRRSPDRPGPRPQVRRELRVQRHGQAGRTAAGGWTSWRPSMRNPIRSGRPGGRSSSTRWPTWWNRAWPWNSGR